MWAVLSSELLTLSTPGPTKKVYCSCVIVASHLYNLLLQTIRKIALHDYMFKKGSGSGSFRPHTPSLSALFGSQIHVEHMITLERKEIEGKSRGRVGDGDLYLIMNSKDERVGY